MRFAFRALGSGLQRVLVTAWAGGTFLAELALEVSVQESAPYVDGLERVAPVGTLRAEPGEVTLQVRFDGKQYTFQLLSGEYLFDPVVAEAVTAQPGEPLERMIATLRAMATGSGGGYSAANARKWMERAGMGLWNDMVPDLIKEQFWRLRGSVSAFSIAVGRDVMPWELLYPLAQGCDEGFLVEQFPVMRRVYGQQRSHRIIAGNAMYVMPEGSRPMRWMRSARSGESSGKAMQGPRQSVTWMFFLSSLSLARWDFCISRATIRSQQILEAQQSAWAAGPSCHFC